MSRWKIGLAGTAVLAAFVIPSAASAQGSGAEDPIGVNLPALAVESGSAGIGAAPAIGVCGDVITDDDLVDWTPEEIAAINAENEELAAALRAAGIDVTMETDELGITYPVWDESDNEAARQVFEEYFADEYGHVDIGDGYIDIGIDDVAFFNEEADALAAHLDAAGIAYTVHTDEMGVRWIEWDYDDEAANAAAEEFFSERYGEFEPFEVVDCELPQEIIDEINADNEALATALRDAGINVTMVTGPDGIAFPEWSEADGAAAEAVLAEFFGDVMDDAVFFGVDELPGEIIDVGPGPIGSVSGVIRVPAGTGPTG